MSQSVSVSALSVGANSKTADLLDGTALAFSPVTGLIKLAVVGAASGLNVTFSVGGVLVIDDQPASSANRFPILDDFLDDAGVIVGQKLRLHIRNTTAGAIVVNIKVVAVAG